MELSVARGTASLPATLSEPDAALRGGVVVLHGASEPERDFFLYAHLAEVLPPHGVAVLRFDRRPSASGRDVPLEVQADDALAAVETLRSHVGGAPVGLWGFSQGAWAAPLAAARHRDAVAFLALVSSCGVSPALQMRIGTGQQLALAGFGRPEQEQLWALRLEVEEYYRGHRELAATQDLVSRAATTPWFEHAYLRSTLPPPGSWPDMDFEPEPVFAAVRCPVLACYGETDEWMPIPESMAAWQRAAEVSHAEVSLARLAGCGHHPTLNEGRDLETVSPQYTETLVHWLDSVLATAEPSLPVPES